MKRIAMFAVLAFGLSFIIMSCKDDNDNNTVPNDFDKTFMTNATYANRSEIDFAQLALTNSQNDSIKAYAQKMVADHTMAQSELDSLGNKFSFTLPTTMDSAHQAMRPQLEALSGYSFDTAYINGQVRDHEATITLFQNEANQGFNPDVRNYASGKLPHLQEHLQSANNVKSSL